MKRLLAVALVFAATGGYAKTWVREVRVNGQLEAKDVAGAPVFSWKLASDATGGLQMGAEFRLYRCQSAKSSSLVWAAPIFTHQAGHMYEFVLTNALLASTEYQFEVKIMDETWTFTEPKRVTFVTAPTNGAVRASAAFDVSAEVGSVTTGLESVNRQVAKARRALASAAALGRTPDSQAAAETALYLFDVRAFWDGWTFPSGSSVPLAVWRMTGSQEFLRRQHLPWPEGNTDELDAKLDAAKPSAFLESLLAEKSALPPEEVVAGLFKYAAGIRATALAPGFRRVILKPTPDRRLGSVDATSDTVYGLVRSAWRYEGKKWIWDFTVPPDAIAEVHVPGEFMPRDCDSGSHHVEVIIDK